MMKSLKKLSKNLLGLRDKPKSPVVIRRIQLCSIGNVLVAKEA